INKLGKFAVTILAAAGACCGVEARAADTKTCTGLWDFIETDCQLTWYGITLYGAIDAGFGYQTHGAPLDPRSPPGASYLVQRYSRSARWDVAPNRSAETSLWSLLWTPVSTLIRSNCPADRDRWLTTPVFPRTSKPPGPIR